MQLLVVSDLIKSCSWFDNSCSSVVRCSSAVRRNLIHGSSGSHGLVDLTCRCLLAVWWFSLPFVQMVQFHQSVSSWFMQVVWFVLPFSCWFSWFGSSVCSFSLSIRCRWPVLPKTSQLSTLVDCWDFLPTKQGLYSVKIFYPAYI